MKLVIEIITMILSAAAAAVFAVRYMLASTYSNDAETEEIVNDAPSRNNIISSSGSIRRCSALIKHAPVIIDHKQSNILTTRRITRPFATQLTECAGRAMRDLIERLYDLVFHILTVSIAPAGFVSCQGPWKGNGGVLGRIVRSVETSILEGNYRSRGVLAWVDQDDSRVLAGCGDGSKIVCGNGRPNGLAMATNEF